MEVYNHIMAMQMVIMVDNGILVLATIVALIRMVFCHHVKRAITIRAPDIEDTIDFRMKLKLILVYENKKIVNIVNKNENVNVNENEIKKRSEMKTKQSSF